MEIICPHCQQTISFTGSRPSFCGYCGKGLPASVQPSTAFDPEAVTVAPIPSVTEGLGNGSEASRLTATSPGGSTSLAGPAPSVVGGYRLVRLLGSGGMGSVYEAEHPESGRRVALKLISTEFSASAEAVDRFRQEGRLASSIAHPRCVFVLAADEADGRPYIVMELMTGDTLKDHVDREGPVSPADAIPMILDVLEGLKAAHRLGVVHRDIKPSNCFLEAEGRVKVGDFGLSKSLMNESHLTRTGTFLGTPLFASPEQIKGEPVDQQSDVYSVAATLYYLLTGRAPFQTGDTAATLARIVSDDPPSMRSIRSDLSPALDRVVLRGLARQRDRRYRDLEEFRLALLPFVEEDVSIGSLGVRFGAFALDFVVLSLLSLPFSIMMASTQVPGTFVNPGWTAVITTVATTLIWLLYFGVSEGCWGWSPGKRLLGLRVIGQTSHGPPGLISAVLRCLYFSVLLDLGSWFAVGLALAFLPERMTGEEMMANPRMLAMISTLSLGPGLGMLVGTGLLVVTMRRHNGYRGLHEFASGTRTIRLPERAQRLTLAVRPFTEYLIPADGLPASVGPYRIGGALKTHEAENLYLGEDPALGRPVLIQLRSAGSEKLSPERQALARSTRLRWLACGDYQGRPWDAFLLVPCSPLVDLIQARGKLSWSMARPVLEQVNAELAAAVDDGTLPASLELDQVWVQSDGHTVLMDASLRAPRTPPGKETDEDRAIEFFGQVAALLLEGKARPLDTAHGPLRVPLPVHAGEFLAPPLGVDQPGRRLGGLQSAFQSTRDQPTEVTRMRRLGQLALLGLLTGFPVMFMVIGSIMPSIMHAMVMMMLTEQGEHLLRDVQFIEPAHIVAASAHQDPLVRYGASHSWLHDQKAFEELAAQVDHNRSLLTAERQASSGMKAFYLDIFEQQAKLQSQMMRRGRRSDPRDEVHFALSAVGELNRGVAPVFLIMCLSWTFLFPFLWVLWSLMFRGGINMYALGITLVNSGGRRAGPLRCAWRTLLVWLPLAVCFGLSGWLDWSYWMDWKPVMADAWRLTLAVVLGWVGTLLLLGYVVVVLAFPRRGPHDWLAGTYVVPR